MQIASEVAKENVFNLMPITFYIELDEGKLEQSINYSLQSFESYFNLLLENAKLAEEIDKNKSTLINH